MVIICPALCIPGCVHVSSKLSYRRVAACDYRVPEGIDRYSVMVANHGLRDVPLCSAVFDCSLKATTPNLSKVSLDPDKEEPFIQVGKRHLLPRSHGCLVVTASPSRCQSPDDALQGIWLPQ